MVPATLRCSILSEGGRITVEELRYLSIFQDITGAMAYRCIIDDESNRLIFLVKKGEAGKAIDRAGRNIKMLRKLFDRSIEVVEYSDELEEMVKNLFTGVQVLKIDVIERGDNKVVYIAVRDEDKGKAIGRAGRNSKRAKLVLKELFGVTNVIIR